jgi:GT2 family glycosyltransferase
MERISIVLVTHNSGDYVETCLNSVFNQSLKDYELIIIDNASEDTTKLIIKNKYPNAALIENDYNYGPCKARNQGIARAKGSFIVCIDDDVKLDSDFLINIYKAIESSRFIGAVQPKVLMTDGRTIDTAGVALSGLRRFHNIGYGEKDRAEFSRERYVFGVCAAAAIYRREALESVKQSRGYFDEDFFYSVEDVDLSWRIQRKGWQVLYYPDAVCIHRGGLSRKKNNITQYLSMRNRYLMILKNETLIGLIKFIVVFFIYDFWRNLYMLIINHGYLLKASCEIIMLFPDMLRKRRLTIYDN